MLLVARILSDGQTLTDDEISYGDADGIGALRWRGEPAGRPSELLVVVEVPSGLMTASELEARKAQAAKRERRAKYLVAGIGLVGTIAAAVIGAFAGAGASGDPPAAVDSEAVPDVEGGTATERCVLSYGDVSGSRRTMGFPNAATRSSCEAVAQEHCARMLVQRGPSAVQTREQLQAAADSLGCVVTFENSSGSFSRTELLRDVRPGEAQP